MSDQDAAEVRLAYARLFNDNPRPGDALTVLTDLSRYCGFYGVPSIAAWMHEFGAAQGYEINSHELNGKRAVYQRVSSFAALSQEQMLSLARIARFRPEEE